jgi:uncharacterized iron-regulated membrane protein
MNATHGRWIVGLLVVVALAASVVWLESSWKAKNQPATVAQPVEQAAPPENAGAPAAPAEQPPPAHVGDLVG